MKFFVLTAVLTACAVSSLGTAVASDSSLNFERSPRSTECCPCLTGIVCADVTICSPYCGNGPCNFFGCNCDGGCRPFPWLTKQSKQQSLESKMSGLEASESSDFFDIADANKDGKLTFDEWLDSAHSTSISGGDTYWKLVKQWEKFDTANVGYLTKHQAINRKA